MSTITKAINRKQNSISLQCWTFRNSLYANFNIAKLEKMYWQTGKTTELLVFRRVRYPYFNFANLEHIESEPQFVYIVTRNQFCFH